MDVLLAMAILTVLATGYFLNSRGYVARAYDVRRKDDLNNIQIYLESYYDSFDTYPEDLPDCDQSLTFKQKKVSPSIPCDPTTKRPYYYETQADGYQSYKVYALLENTQDASIEKVSCTKGCGPSCAYNYGVSSPNVILNTCDVYYVCAPGGGKEGSCEVYADPVKSNCPESYKNDPTCRNACSDPKNRCKNASGKFVPK